MAQGNKQGISDRLFDWIAMMISRHTWALFFGFFGFMLLISIVGIANGDFNLSDDNDYNWLPADVAPAKRRDAIEQAQKLVDQFTNGTVVRGQAEDDWTMFIMYEAEDDEDIFQPALLQEICEAEAFLLNHPKYDEFCVLSGDECAPQTGSVVNYFYGTSSPDCTLLPESTVQELANNIYAIIRNDSDPDEVLRVGTFVGVDFRENDQYTKYTKSVMSFGAPLAGYIDSNDREDDQQDALTEELLEPVEEDWFDYFGFSSSIFRSPYRNVARKDAVRMEWWADSLNNSEFQRILNGDMAFAILSISFVFVWLTVHTGNFFISIFGILQIVLSLPVAAFIYGTICGIDYFDILHVLTIFLVLGIGADDIFVYTDAWRQSLAEADKEDYETRVRYAYSRTARAVLNTSFTTAVAFLSQTGSSLMPIATLGIYASLTIVLNYLFAVSFTPALVLLAEKHFEKCACCCCKSKDDSGENTDMEMVAVGGSKAGSPEGDNTGKGESRMDKWLDKYYVDVMLMEKNIAGFKIKPVSTFALLFMTGWAIQGIYFALQLTPPNEQEQWFPDDHMWTGFFDDLQDNYIAQSDQQYIDGEVVYGISGIDRSGYSFWEPGKNLGDPEFDPNFDIYPLEAQQSLLRACDLIKEFSCDLSGCSEGLFVWPAFTECFFNDFQTWMNTTYNVQLPSTDISRDTFMERLSEFRVTSREYEKTIGIINGELKFVTIPVLTTVPQGAGYEKLGDAIDRANELSDALTADSTASSLKTTFFNGGLPFVFYETQKALISNLFTGLAICTPVVFVLLILATKNVQISLVAVISVLSIVASVLGMCQWAGWSLGIAEAIAGVIVIGFAVDYTLHLGHMYMEASHHGLETREERFRFAVHTMGSTVVANSITTFGSGVFMFAAQFTFFFKMATLMCTTIAFSFLFSSGFFMAHCAVIGPQGEFANIKTPAQCRKD